VILAALLIAAVADDEPAVQAADGFKVELLHTATPGEGSWVSMTFEPGGSLIVSPQEGPLHRVTLPKVRVKKLAAGVGDAQGLLHAYGSLYVNGKGSGGTGLYRLFDRDGDGEFEESKLLRRWPIEMTEHGPHGIALGPDGRLYVINGNYTKAPEDVSPRSPLRGSAEDLLLPRQWDATGHAVGLLAPGGVVLRADPDGKEWELFCGGLRNAYDLAFDAEGELFTYDSDMERDLGTPWYRPTKIFHLVPGGEYGWRSGTGKWPSEYPDSLPAAVDVGRGSPTGVTFGAGAKFPARYRRAFFAADWAFGRILAVHLEPNGASFKGSVETFVRGEPLNVTDLEVGPDGALYFITGGRGTRSRLYRVSYAGPAAAEPPFRDEGAEARVRRRKLESDDLLPWAELDHPDRWIRYAARLALERRPAESWRERALAEGPAGALIAAARLGRREDGAAIVDRLCGLPLSDEVLRAFQLAFIRCGPAGPSTRARALARLDPLYPAGRYTLDRELAQLLAYLGAERFIPRTLDLLAASAAREEQTHYAFVLRTVRSGWTEAERRTYFEWFGRFSDYRGDIGFPLFLRNIRTDALKTLDPEERRKLQPLLDSQFKKATALYQDPGAVVRRWTLEEFLPDVERRDQRRNITRGKASFAKAQCLTCHPFAGEGGAVGPDLTGVGKRLGRRDLLEAILRPSKDVSDQFRLTLVQKHDEEVLVGRILDADDGKIVLATDPFAEERVEIARGQIRRLRTSETSPMPEGLLDRLPRLEVLDLIAYLLTDGRE
jgi:putative heme-binding domain-containing protein